MWPGITKTAKHQLAVSAAPPLSLCLHIRSCFHLILPIYRTKECSECTKALIAQWNLNSMLMKTWTSGQKALAVECHGTIFADCCFESSLGLNRSHWCPIKQYGKPLSSGSESLSLKTCVSAIQNIWQFTFWDSCFFPSFFRLEGYNCPRDIWGLFFWEPSEPHLMMGRKKTGSWWGFSINKCLDWTENVLFMPLLMEKKKSTGNL